MIWNRRITRILVGISLLALVIVLMLPSLTGFTSLDGTVNARFAIVNAPIDGEVVETPPKVGAHVLAGETLALIRNARVNRAILTSLHADHMTAVEHAAALKRERDELVRLRDQLAVRMEVFTRTTIADLERQVEILKKRVKVSEAQDNVAQVDFDRRLALEAKGILSTKMVESARAAWEAAGGELEISGLTVAQLEQKLAAVRQGVFVLGDGQNDVPYSRQRQDEVTVRINDLNTRVAENETRAAQAQKQLIEEENRVRSLISASVPSPFDGVVWSSNVVNGSNVILNNELMRILDCSDLFVDILVPEVDYQEIYPGLAAEARVLGAGDVFKGVVLSVRGSAAVAEKDTLAANQPETTKRNDRIRVGLAPSALNTDFANFCQVGRSVQVRLPKPNIRIWNWVEGLWFSIS
ncbi:HlyD family efflux transporter periplasmic adaptor subunit (plasmid) [Rhizobium sullae]|uniref:HlyD family efflux transporter periplasmic adaptor subunit n=1 Tax=Rhizobium sullae TaxID=50338 RepID=A0ABY5XS37_RHISU|nr:HlyD family efflux transporter periplasmic adaptor subunit [Rhizobium sullae]UWU17041.1 HlyD family efflux transporter periplasmic adaptor subunit [Rhizobium sullae]